MTHDQFVSLLKGIRNEKVACFGSRETPDNVLIVMRMLARQLSYHQNCRIASGHCQGADLAFEQGANPEKMIVCLPWSSYNDNIPVDTASQKKVLGSLPSKDQEYYFRLAKAHHPVWDTLSNGVKLLHGRNILIGQDALLGICYLSKKAGGGGSGQCYRYLTSMNVPVLDLSKSAHLKIAQEYLSAAKEI
jgi:hypothetical protein